MDRSFFGRFLLPVAGVALVSLAMSMPAEAKVAPKNGVYYQALGTAYGQLTTAQGKVTSISAALKFKTSGGAFCQQGEFNTSEEFSLVVFTPSRPLAVNGKSRFSLKNVSLPDAPGARLSLNGKFVNRSKATFFVKVTIGACKANLNVTNAKYYAGG